MKKVIESAGYGRFKFTNSLLFVAFGILIIVQMARGIGLRFEALSGYVLGLALIALGVYRIRTFYVRPRP